MCNLESMPLFRYSLREFLIGRGVFMPMTENQRNLRRRQRRVRKLRALKTRLEDTQDVKTRRRLIEKIRRISPWEPIPDK